MATSGTFTGGRSGTGPWLTLAWEEVSQDIANNRTKIKLTLRLHSEYSISFSADKTGSLEGTNFTFTSGFSGTGSKVLKTKEMWVNHNSAGEGSITLNGSFNIAISWGGSTVSTLTVSGTATMDDIPRASDFTAFTLSNTTLNTSTAVTVNYTLGRKSSSFSHAMTLKIGSKTIKSWTTSSTGALTQALSTTEVNNIIASVPNSTTGSLTLTMQTKSGSTNVGSSKTITETFSLNSAIKPSASGLTIGIAGSGRDKTINQYVQGITKVTASFTRSAGYGATISSSTINIKRTSDGGNSQTISSNSGTTANPVSLSGGYTVTATVKDSRGRSTTLTTTFTVQAYSVPKITKFAPTRNNTTRTTINIPFTVAWSPLGTNNPASVKITQTTGGTSTDKYSVTGQTSGSINTTQNITGVTETTTHVLTLTITDSFGKSASSKVTIGTAFVELSIAKGLGIGVGKVHERGSLDVAGDIYLTAGTFHAPSSRYANSGAGLDLHNSDIVGLNQMYFNDVAGGQTEAIQFPKDNRPAAGHADYYKQDYYDSLWCANGVIRLNNMPLNVIDGQNALWSGAVYLLESHTITPSKTLNDCAHGWILVWSDYQASEGGPGDSNYNMQYVHKRLVQKDLSGKNYLYWIPNASNGGRAKTMYITNTTVKGHTDNDEDDVQKDIALRYVYEW